MCRLFLCFMLTIGVGLSNVIYAQDDQTQSSHIVSLAWSPDNIRIAASFSDSTVKIWRVGEDSELGLPILTFQPDLADQIDWTPDSRYVVVQGTYGTEDGLLRAEATKWNAETGDLVETLMSYELNTAFDFNRYAYTGFPVIAFDPTFTQAAFSLNSNAVYLSDGTQIIFIEYGIVKRILWSPDGARLAVVYGNTDTYRIQTFEVMSGSLINTIWGQDYYVTDLQWNKDGSQLAVSSLWANPFNPYINIRTYTITAGNDYLAGEDRFWGFEGREGGAIAWSPQANLLAAAYPRAIDVFTMISENPITSIEAEDVSAVDWSPDGSQIAGALADGTIQIWDISPTND
jgi:WD40 repeat protein